ncbi:hypothetical protein MM300_19310 [Evansella sp. LMS18]|uniref:hypothetical protein n=1 Tax=Evansella sp. LMS18 TaxID=2924033 RepID=UPI0020D1C1B8|nr:hypothetical protein [Evansella sp. LMS18]UTR10003.1 hypothetical protein MM300_19310 [Evansella sp. LMS18]
MAHETDVEKEKSDEQQADTKEGKQKTENLPDNNEEDGSEPGSEGLFWKSTNEGNIVYMLGSFHAGTEEMYPMNSDMKKRSSGQIILFLNTI